MFCKYFLYDELPIKLQIFKKTTTQPLLSFNVVNIKKTPYLRCINFVSYMYINNKVFNNNNQICISTPSYNIYFKFILVGIILNIEAFSNNQFTLND